MEALMPWLTPALILALFGWLRSDIRGLRQDVNKRIDELKAEVARNVETMDRRFEGVNRRFDELNAETNRRFDELDTETNHRFEALDRDMNKRFDQVNRELAEQRERMAKLEGSLDGFLAGRRDRDAA